MRLRATPDSYGVVLADLAEAEAFWSTQRPSVAIDHPPDPDYFELVDLHDIPAATPSERGVAIGRFGGKVTGLATLYPTLDPVYQTAGFGLPSAYYLKFMAENAWELAVDGEKQVVSFADTIELWLADPKFRSDTATRKAWLSALAAAMRQKGAVDPALVAAVETQVKATFGAANVMVRFRSSSNVEDGLDFNGAGLYTSVSGCAADEDDSGKSACDPDKGARPVDAAIKEVWASLWNFGAFEEREYYQLDHAGTAMGILVSKQYEDEQANGVAFTGDPTDRKDHRFTINVQAGEVDVVEAPAGTIAELDRLTIVDGEVTAIGRAPPAAARAPRRRGGCGGPPQPPSRGPRAGRGPTAAQRPGLGALLADIAAVYPVELGEHDPADVLLDLEFKYTKEGKLILKQIRPFLRGAADPSQLSCEWAPRSRRKNADPRRLLSGGPARGMARTCALTSGSPRRASSPAPRSRPTPGTRRARSRRARSRRASRRAARPRARGRRARPGRRAARRARARPRPRSRARARRARSAARRARPRRARARRRASRWSRTRGSSAAARCTCTRRTRTTPATARA